VSLDLGSTKARTFLINHHSTIPIHFLKPRHGFRPCASSTSTCSSPPTIITSSRRALLRLQSTFPIAPPTLFDANDVELHTRPIYYCIRGFESTSAHGSIHRPSRLLSINWRCRSDLKYEISSRQQHLELLVRRVSSRPSIDSGTFPLHFYIHLKEFLHKQRRLARRGHFSLPCNELL